MSILVVGGAGFIGYHLCKTLVQDNESVICIDNLYSGQEKHINELLQYSNFTFYNKNIIYPFQIEGDIKEIYHLACPASPKYYQKDEIYTLNTCYLGTYNMLQLAQKKNARILFTSTSEIYGEPQVHPQNEEYKGNVNTFGPRSCYDEGKRISETLLYVFQKKGVSIRIARIFNTYGPYMKYDDGRVISNFINQALSGQPITIYGSGNQTRSFCFINDMIEGLLLLMKSNYTQPINLGNPNEISMNTLAYKIKELTKSQSELQYLPLPKDDPTRRKPNIKKAQTILQWKPTTSLVQGLIHTIYYYYATSK
tara:strand:+ start:59 stop:988 length:930 start_codon:yes stop_codon:yes gene_type:complete